MFVKVLETYCQQHVITVDEWLSDIGSGLNYTRKQFTWLMKMVELVHSQEAFSGTDK